jgi:hypothetical protein
MKKKKKETNGRRVKKTVLVQLFQIEVPHTKKEMNLAPKFAELLF